jgi:hypothetical protein
MSAVLDRLLKPPRARLGAVMVMVAMVRAWPHDNANLAKYRAGVKRPANFARTGIRKFMDGLAYRNANRFAPSLARSGCELRI